MPILIVGALAGAFLTHFWHREATRQAHQEARLNELHEKLGASFAASQKMPKKE